MEHLKLRGSRGSQHCQNFGLHIGSDESIVQILRRHFSYRRGRAAHRTVDKAAGERRFFSARPSAIERAGIFPTE
jgi:hypothetical protein